MELIGKLGGFGVPGSHMRLKCGGAGCKLQCSLRLQETEIGARAQCLRVVELRSGTHIPREAENGMEIRSLTRQEMRLALSTYQTDW